MSIPTVASVRQAIEDRVLLTTLSGGGSLTLSLFPHFMFRDAERSPRHLECAVGASSSEVADGRARPGAVVMTRTSILVVVAYELPTHDPDIDPALVVEDEVRRQVLGETTSYPGNFSPMWRRSDRTPMGAPGWIALESAFDVLHFLQM